MADSHEKSMGSYARHAREDAIAIAQLMSEEVDFEKARALYEAQDFKTIFNFEQKNRNFIAEFIELPGSKRHAYLKRVLKDTNPNVRTIFLTLCVIGVLRAEKMFEIRDYYRQCLAPGLSYRTTTSGIYRFAEAVASAVDHSWPTDFFDQMHDYI